MEYRVERKVRCSARGSFAIAAESLIMAALQKHKSKPINGNIYVSMLIVA